MCHITHKHLTVRDYEGQLITHLQNHARVLSDLRGNVPRDEIDAAVTHIITNFLPHLPSHTDTLLLAPYAAAPDPSTPRPSR